MKCRPLLPLLATGIALGGCDRSDEAAQNVIVTAQRDAKAAPRSIMRPTIAAPEPAPPPPAPTIVTIPFGTPHAGLDDAQRATLDQLATRLAGTGDTLILRGHSDSRGSDRRNHLVSLHRARITAAYLETKGIAAARIRVIALGEDRPIAPNAMLDGSDDPAGRARNRRVEAEIVAAAPPPPVTPAPAAAAR